MLRELHLEELNPDLFSDFQRHQAVTKCWRKIDGKWVIIDYAFTEEWSPADYRYLVQCLKNTVSTGGVVYGAFQDGKLKGFASVEARFFGSMGQYLELSSIHVSEDCRGAGMGRRLLGAACRWATEKGAKKLYISAHSSVESQAFYKAMDCREAAEYSKPHVEKEPCDCQLELVL